MSGLTTIQGEMVTFKCVKATSFELMHLKRNNCLTSISTYVIVKNEVDIKAVEMEYK